MNLKLLFTTIIVSSMVAIPAFAAQLTPYQEGVRDYRAGLHFRARPYFHEGTAEQAAQWELGYFDAQRRDRKRRR